MKKISYVGLLGLGLSLGLLWSASAHAIEQELDASQNDYEKSISSVVRRKNFYKADRFEIGGFAGLMPYDSLMNHYMVGGRLTWHFSDHFGWEIADAHVTFPSTTSYTTDLVSGKSLTGGVQVQRTKLMAASNFLVSPLYGKLRLFGASTLHFDLYLVGGLGFHSSEIMNYALTGGTVTETVLNSNGGLMFDFGFGAKMFFNNAMGMVIDFRDYFTMTTIYGKTAPKSNFTVMLGLVFFVPTFG